jgi:cytochrome c553
MIRTCALACLLLVSTAALAQLPAPPAAPNPAAPDNPQAPAVPGNAQAPGALTGDPAKGREKTQLCEGCHGIEGWRTAYPEVYRVPKIGGQHEAYIVSALRQYKSGDRSHPSMRAIASSLTDADIANLAAFYARAPLQQASK